MSILAKAAFGFSGIPMSPLQAGTSGRRGCLSPDEAVGASSAAAENTKDLWRPRRRRGKIDLSEKNSRIY